MADQLDSLKRAVKDYDQSLVKLKREMNSQVSGINANTRRALEQINGRLDSIQHYLANLESRIAAIERQRTSSRVSNTRDPGYAP